MNTNSVRVVGVAMLLLALACPLHGRTAPPSDPQLAAEAIRGLEAILDLWRDGNYRLLYERTNVAGRESRERFTRKLAANSSRRPACCWEKLQDVSVSARGGDTVMVRGRFGLEGGPGGTEYVTRSVRLDREDGIWKVSQSDILALAGAKRKR